MNPRWISRFAIAACCIRNLSLAIKNGELSLHYQPQAASGQTVASSAVIGFEALARWLHPVRGFVPPADFIPLAKRAA